MKKNLTYSLTIFSVLVLAGIALIRSMHNETDINCQSRTILHDGQNVLTMKSVLHISKNDNFFDVFLTFRQQGSSEENFHRVVNFNYDKNKDIYQMFSDVTNDNTMNRDVRNKLNDMLPDFFLMPQRGIRLKINRLKNGNYTILNDRLPVFLCMPVAN